MRGSANPMDYRLLIVDDDVGLTKIVAATAATLGIVASQINDPAQALDAFIDFRPDVVMLDIFMPEKDGIELLDEILLTGIPTRIILTSGMGEDLLPVAQDAIRFHGGPVAIYLAKPFQRAELVDVLTEAGG
jgi:two-component system response regulator MtrA